MDRERLNHLLQEPTAVDAADVAVLRELAGRYPWFSGAQVLLTVGEAATGGLLYDEHLRQVAAHLPSRARVHDLVHADAGPTPRQRSTPVDAGPLTVPVTLEPMAPAPEAGSPGPVEEAPPTVPSAPSGATPEEAGLNERPEQAPPAVPDDLDDQIRSAALATVYDLTWSTAHDRQELPEPAVTVPEEEPATPTAATQPQAERPAEAPPQAIARPGRMRFTAWLEEAPTPNGPATTEAAQAKAPQEASADVPTPKASPAQAIPGAMDTKALIERFIQGQAPPSARKAEFFTPQQAAKRSLEEHAELVTETLARIYEQQGDAARAAAAYRRLAERHPQRREEFLARAVAVERGKG